MYLVFISMYQIIFFLHLTFLHKELLLEMIDKSVLVTELKANKTFCKCFYDVCYDVFL